MRYPLELRLKPSRQIIFMIAAIHLIAAIAFLLLHASWWIKVPVLLILGASFTFLISNDPQPSEWCAVGAARKLRRQRASAGAVL